MKDSETTDEKIKKLDGKLEMFALAAGLAVCLIYWVQKHDSGERATLRTEITSLERIVEQQEQQIDSLEETVTYLTGAIEDLERDFLHHCHEWRERTLGYPSCETPVLIQTFVPG